MNALFAQLTFLNPWILATAALLPVLWYLLRVTPPAPKKIFFPAVRFLKGLVPERMTPSKTPWWLLLLRCLIAGLVILALARPVLNPADVLPGRADVRIIVENGWASAQIWDKQIQQAEEIIAQAERENRNVYIMTTAPEPVRYAVMHQGPQSPAQALGTLRGLKPLPYNSDFEMARARIESEALEKSATSFWVGNGLNSPGAIDFARAVQAQGGLYYYRPEDSNLPIAVKIDEGSNSTDGIDLIVDMASAGNAALPINIHAVGENGNVLDYQTFTVTPQNGEVKLLLPDTVRNEVARINIAGRNSAATTLLFDERYKKRSVGIVTADDSTDPKPLIDASFYLIRALEPYTTLKTGTIDKLVGDNPSVIIMPDIGAMPPETLEKLGNWVKDGGMLLRFAGSAMSATENFLVPVPLLKGTRALAGDMTWSDPQKLAPFAENSPFFGIEFSDAITVRQQILAEPVPDLEQKTWATLEDGTPMITADKMDQGMLVLIHTTATPDWSDLALSGLYVDLMRKIIALSRSKQVSGFSSQSLQALSVLDGFGRQVEPKNIKPIPANEFDTIRPGPDHPPGFYGTGGSVQALNLGTHLAPINVMGTMPLGVTEKTYSKTYETDLMPALLAAAFAFLIVDWLIMLVIATGFTMGHGIKTASILLALLCVPLNAQAQDSDISFAGEIYLAYIKTTDTAVNQTAEQGLNALGLALTQRTSVEPKGTVALNPESDTLSFFPFIYWPITEEPITLSQDGLQNIQHYLDHGGTILFDTRDQNRAVEGGMAQTSNARSLQTMIGSLNIPALTKAGNDHVLRRSFYLLDDFPGRYANGPLWVEQQSANGRDGVSSVLIGGNDWAAAWGAEMGGGTMRPYLTGGPRQQEMSIRFGINMMMYALTGNYKADQVHLPHILERLGQ